MIMNMKKLVQSTALRKLFGCAAVYAVIQLLLSTRVLSDYYFATIVTIGINIILAVRAGIFQKKTACFAVLILYC